MGQSVKLPWLAPFRLALLGKGTTTHRQGVNGTKLYTVYTGDRLVNRMFTKILVALDVSEAAQTVFAQALSLAEKYQAQLYLLHVLSAEEETSPIPIPVNLDEVYPAPGNEMTMELWQEQWELFEKRGLELLQSRTQEARDRGITAEFEQVLGSPGKTICKLAKDNAMDMIVVGHRGRWGFSEILLGSVSNYVFHHAPCSVLVVPTPDV